MALFKPLHAELFEGYRDAEFCIGAMHGAVESYEETGNLVALTSTFANAARARGTEVSGIIALLETDPERRVTSLGGWDNIKSLLV